MGWGFDFGGLADIPLEKSFVDIEAGWFSGTARREDGSLVVWGTVAGGGKSAVEMGQGIIDFAPGKDHTLAILAVPEPSSVLLLASAAVSLLLFVRRRGQQR